MLARWIRWARLTLGSEHDAHPIVHAAYLRGALDALDALALAERERYCVMHKNGDQSAKGDAVLAHSLLNEAVRRAKGQSSTLISPHERRAIGERRMQRLRAELSYLCGEGRPDALDLPAPGRGRYREGARFTVPSPSTEASSSTDKSNDKDNHDRCEWYADNDERRSVEDKQLLPQDDYDGSDE